MPIDIMNQEPDYASLGIFSDGKFYLWKIQNGGLHRLENIRREISAIQTFDLEKRG
jgi:hypothetical protein